MYIHKRGFLHAEGFRNIKVGEGGWKQHLPKISDTQLRLEKHLMSGTVNVDQFSLEVQEDKSTKFIWPCASLTSDKQLNGNCNIYIYINLRHFLLAIHLPIVHSGSRALYKQIICLNIFFQPNQKLIYNLHKSSWDSSFICLLLFDYLALIQHPHLANISWCMARPHLDHSVLGADKEDSLTKPRCGSQWGRDILSPGKLLLLFILKIKFPVLLKVPKVLLRVLKIRVMYENITNKQLLQ